MGTGSMLYTALDNGFFMILGNVLRDKIHRILGVHEISVRQKDFSLRQNLQSYSVVSSKI